MKIYTTSILILLFHYNICGQNTYPIKEHFDKLHPTILPIAPINYANHFTTGDNLSWALSSLLRIYEATGDKAYLVKFMNHCIQLHSKNDTTFILTLLK